MFVRLRLFVFVLAALVGGSSLGQAQQTSVAERTAPAAGPRLDVTAIAFRQLAQEVYSTETMQSRRRQGAGKPVALMIVGGAAIVLGAVIGDAPGTLFMIGGAVALLVGLYQYLQ